MQSEMPNYPDLEVRWARVKDRIGVNLLPDGTYRTYVVAGTGGFGIRLKWALQAIDSIVYFGPEQVRFLTRAEAEELIQEGERRLANDKPTPRWMENSKGEYRGTIRNFDWEKYYLEKFVPAMKSLYLEPTVPQIIHDRATHPKTFAEFNALPVSEQMSIIARLSSTTTGWANETSKMQENLLFFLFWRHIFDLKYSGKPVYKVVKKIWATIVAPAVDWKVEWGNERTLIFRKIDWIFEHPIEEYAIPLVMVVATSIITPKDVPDITMNPDYVMINLASEMSQAEWDQRVLNAMREAELEAGITDGRLTFPAVPAGAAAGAASRPTAVPVVAKPKDRTLLYAGIGAGAGLLGAVAIALASSGGRRR